ncbi:UNKNOWN [Stylonychia lemnae]|uniref:Uncharacterized protein n=1 Tax=Stylonychia lemnae TaxID=5949 RepID=A0A078B4M3_STYLE|nr:UNKNOWN [Stylonychia lemnae]|eukprot:CDW88458.1 UNKNOWN [Stylonychia lemnae]
MQALDSSVQFSQLYEKQRIEERNIQIAKSILDSIDQLETEPDSVKRWGWELIQNAQDASDPEKPVKIRIILEYDKLRFLHNGKPFSLKDIMNLVDKGSDKDRPQYFSEQLQPKDDFDSFLQGNNNAFSQQINNVQILNLDNMVIPETTGRDTKNVNQMLSYNKKSSEVLQNLDNHENWPFLSNYESGLDFDTTFTYYLSEQGVRNAKEGLKNLIASIPYVIAFSKKIETIEIFDKTEQQRQQYTFRIERDPVVVSGETEILKYFINDEEKYLIHSFNKYTQLACLVLKTEENFYEICEKDSCIPNFFVDYPLIGSQSLRFSVVFNSHLFYPNEKRSGICLDESLGFKAQLNTQHQLAGDKNRFLKNLLINPIITKFVNSAIIECKGGLTPLKNIMIPNIELHKLKSVNYYLQQFDSQLKSFFIAVFDDPDWKPHLSNTQKCSLFQILAALDDVKKFLQKIYLYIANYKDLNYKERIKEFKLYVDQNNLLKKLVELQIDEEIDENYKKICLSYGYDLRAKLFNNSFIPHNYRNISKMNVEKLDYELSQDVNRILEKYKSHNYQKPNRNQIFSCQGSHDNNLSCLLNIDNETKLQKFTFQIIGLSKSQVCNVKNVTEQLWNECSRISVHYLRKQVKQADTLCQLEQKLGLMISAINFLKLFYAVISDYNKLYTLKPSITKSKTLHTSLPQAILLRNLKDNHEIFTSFKLCQEFDQIIVGRCSSIDYIKKSESFINRFDKLHQSTFKDININYATATEYYFPKYSKERKNILVKLRQNGEMTNLLYEIYQNEQEVQMRLLTKAKKSNYQVLEAILKYVGEKEQISQKFIDVMNSYALERMNDQGLKELIDNMEYIASNNKQQPQAQPQLQISNQNQIGF